MFIYYFHNYLCLFIISELLYKVLGINDNDNN